MGESISRSWVTALAHSYLSLWRLSDKEMCTNIGGILVSAASVWRADFQITIIIKNFQLGLRRYELIQ